MAEESDLERTESATPRRIQRAREEGQVLRSRELSTFVELAVGAGALFFLGGHLYETLSRAMRASIALDRAQVFDVRLMLAHFQEQVSTVLLGFLPFLLALAASALIAPFLLSGWNFSAKPLVPDFARLSPAKGLARMFSSAALAELVKALVKSVLIGLVAAWAIGASLELFLGLPGEAPVVGLAKLAHSLLTAMLAIVAAFLLVVALDVPFQAWHYAKNLRMSKEEVRQELKETEGDPQIRARIRALQREVARRRMMAEIPKARVIVTNPLHFAVALAYDEERMGAPRVVAKGSQLLASRIVEVAREHGVPVLSAPPLARALYRHTEIGEEIPRRLYTAVAQVLAYVYQLEHAAPGKEPPPPEHLPVPPDMDFHPVEERTP